MTPRELLAAGELSAAVAAQGALLRAKPTDQDGRWFLFVLLCWAGELDRAILQLDMLAEQNAEFGMGSTVYRSLVTAEAERAAVLTRDGNPLLPPDSGAHAEARLAALKALRSGDSVAARRELERAESLRPALEGKLDGEAFDELFDSDELFGPILEVLAGGHYLWLPLERVRKLEIQPAGHQLELLWVPAQLEDSTGLSASVHLPALYHGSAGEADGRLRAGQMTEWREVDGVCIRGAGQRVLLARRGDLEREYALRDLRTLEMAPPPSEARRG
jgi:type VI secretion system protein ImpE